MIDYYYVVSLFHIPITNAYPLCNTIPFASPIFRNSPTSSNCHYHQTLNQSSRIFIILFANDVSQVCRPHKALQMYVCGINKYIVRIFLAFWGEI